MTPTVRNACQRPDEVVLVFACVADKHVVEQHLTGSDFFENRASNPYLELRLSQSGINAPLR